MVDFSLLTDEEVIEFIVNNQSLFGTKLSDDFPKSIYLNFGGGMLFFVKRREGFAVCYKGRPPRDTWPGYDAELEFIHVADSFSGQGIGHLIVQDVMTRIRGPMTLALTCEGIWRKSFFEKCGFKVEGHDETHGLFRMTWTPLLSE